MRTTLITVLLHACLLSINLCAVEPPGVAWTDADRVALGSPSMVVEPRRLVSDEQLAKARASMQRYIPTAVRFEPGIPPYGVIMHLVTPGSQAALAGIEPDDIVTAITSPERGRITVGFNFQFLRARKDAQTATLSCWSPRRGSYEVPVQPGTIGLNFEESALLGGYCGRAFGSLPPVAVADHLETVCAAVDANEVAVAESALAQAMATGLCPRPFVDHALAIIAWKQGRHEVAWNCALNALGTLTGQPAGRLIDVLYETAILTGDRTRASYIAARWPNLIFKCPVLIKNPTRPVQRKQPEPAFVPVAVAIPAAVRTELDCYQDVLPVQNSAAHEWRVVVEADIKSLGPQAGRYPASISVDLVAVGHEADYVARLTAFDGGVCSMMDMRIGAVEFASLDRHSGHVRLTVTFIHGVLNAMIGDEVVSRGFPMSSPLVFPRIRVVSGSVDNLNVTIGAVGLRPLNGGMGLPQEQQNK